jgi:hypothetical protein
MSYAKIKECKGRIKILPNRDFDTLGVKELDTNRKARTTSTCRECRSHIKFFGRCRGDSRVWTESFQKTTGCNRSRELRISRNFYIRHDINESVVPENLEERQSTVINDDDSKPSSKCGPTAQFFRACALQNLVLATLLFSFSHFLVAGNRIPWLLGRGKVTHEKLPHNDGLRQPKSTRARFELTALTVEAAVLHQPSRQRTDRLSRRRIRSESYCLWRNGLTGTNVSEEPAG